jgi:NADPH2:quinone reductase
MRAIVCDQLGEATEVLRLDEHFPAPQLLKGHVRIRVVAASINFPDYLQIKGEYQVKPELPFVPGSEVSGVVVELGPGVTKLSVGDKVGAAALQCSGGLHCSARRCCAGAREAARARG